MGTGGLIGIILSVIAVVVGQVTPELRSLLADMYSKLKAAAAKTKSPFDDFLVKILGGLLGLE